MTKPKFYVLTGPTGVGKTETSIRLAHTLNAEIISADSMQVYRRMDIGTDKIKPERMDGVPHHLIDVLEPDEPFDVFRFQQMVGDLLPGIYNRGHVPLLVGGTGFYILSVLYDIRFGEDSEEAALLRSRLERDLLEQGAHAMHERLEQVDPVSARDIHENNHKRMIRALEYYLLTGQTMSEHNAEEHNRTSPYDFRYFVLTDEREELYRRIDKRVDQMIEEGLETEVRTLMQDPEHPLKADMTSMQGLGYREMAAYLNGDCDLEEAVRLIKRNTRHFAKRQLTWFRREKEVLWIPKQEFGRDTDRILERILALC